MGVWQFIQDQVFGMKWLNELIGKGLSKLGLDVGERIGGSIQFFFYDVLKITVLLCQRRKVKDFFIKFTKKPQKKCQKQILAPDTFADGLFAPA